MTTRSELLDMMANGENSLVEFKRDDDLDADSLARELVAFSNTYGGKLLLGVEDDGTVTGIKRADLEQWVVNICRDKIRPEIVPSFEIMNNVKNGRDVAIVGVLRSYAVHAFLRNKSNRYLIRVGSQCREASQEELRRLFQQKGSLHAELMPVSGASVSNLDWKRLRDYFGRIRQQDIPEDHDENAWKKILVNNELMMERNAEMMSEEGISVACMLLFGRNPNRFLPQSGISAFAFQGAEKDYDTRERQQIRGALTHLRDGAGEIVENGIVEQALEFVRRNTRASTRSEGAVRSSIPVYTDDVLREGIVNAVTHRDYLLTGTDIELSVYSDRLEIVTPGHLHNGITPERMRAGARSHRNPLLAHFMRDYGYCESMGMGVRKKIIPGMNEHNKTDPDLIEDHERFILRLLAMPSSDAQADS